MDTKEGRIKEAALQMGAQAVGIADAGLFRKYVPEGYRPEDLLPGAKSVIAMGNRRYTSGQWMTSNIDVIHRARSAQSGRDSAGFGVAKFIEREFGQPAIFIGPAMFDNGMNPAISLKVCAELAGLGTRSMAGAIILNRDHGLLGFVAVITAMDLAPDGPLTEPVCPDPVCVAMWEKVKITPCMEACSAIEGTIENGRLKEVIWYRQLCCARALNTMNGAFIRLLPEIMNEEDSQKRKYLTIGEARRYGEDPPGRGIWGRCIECMRVCPVNRRANRLEKGGYDG